MDLLKQNKMDDVLVLVGGIIPDQDIAALKQQERGGYFLSAGNARWTRSFRFIRANVKGAGSDHRKLKSYG